MTLQSDVIIIEANAICFALIIIIVFLLRDIADCSKFHRTQPFESQTFENDMKHKPGKARIGIIYSENSLFSSESTNLAHYLCGLLSSTGYADIFIHVCMNVSVYIWMNVCMYRCMYIS